MKQENPKWYKEKNISITYSINDIYDGCQMWENITRRTLIEFSYKTDGIL